MVKSIIPPEMLQSSTSSAKSEDGASKFDRKEFYPSSLVAETSESFRLLGCYSTGHAALFWRYPVETLRDGELRFSGFHYSKGYPGSQPENIARATDWSNPARPKLADEYVKPKSALLWLVWSEARKRVELLLIEQRGLKESLTEILQEDEDYTFNNDGISNFTLKITRKGTGLETSYSILPKLSAKVSKEVTEAFKEVSETAVMSVLLNNDGSHPLIKPAASFSSSNSSDEEGGEF